MALKVGELFATLGLDDREFNTKLSAAGRSWSDLAQRLGRIGKTITMGVTLPITAAAAAAVKAYASQEQAEADLRAALEQTGKVTEAAMRRYGRFASSIQDVTIYEDDAVLSGMAYAKNLGVQEHQLEQATKAAVGLAAKFKIDLQTALMLVGRASQGQTQMLTRYGIVLDEQLSPQDRFNQLLKIGADNFVLAEKAAKTGTGSLTQMKNIIGDAAEEFGRVLMPYVKDLAELIRGLAVALRDMNPEVRKALMVIAGLAAAAGPLLTILPGLVSLFSALPAVIGGVSTAIGVLSGPIGWIAGAIGLVVVAWVRDWGHIREVTAGALEAVKGWIKSAWTDIADWTNTWWPEVKKTIMEVWKTIGPYVMAALAVLKAELSAAWSLIKTQTAVAWQAVKAILGTVWDGIKLTVGTALDVILTGIRTFLKLLRGDWSGAWDELHGLIERQTERMRTFLTSVADRFYDAGRKIIERLAAGIRDLAGAPYKAAKDALQKIANLLPHSDPKEGPLRGLTHMGELIPTMLAEGIENAAPAMTEAMERPLSAIEKMLADMKDRVGNAWQQFAQSLQSRLQQAFESAFRGGSGLKDFFKNLWDDILSIVAEVLAQIAMKAILTSKVIQAAFAGIGGGGAGGIGGGLTGAGILGAAGWALGGPVGGAIGSIVGGMLGLAEGGYIRTPGPVIVGERGPEILNLPQGASVTPMAKAGTSISVTVHTGPVSNIGDVAQIGETLARVVNRRLALARG